MLDVVPESNRAFYDDSSKVKASTTGEALRQAGLDWTVITEPIKTKSGKIIPGYVRTTRADDPSITFGIVTPRYQPVQNIDAFAVCDEIAARGAAVWEAGGTARGQKFVWGQMRLTQEISVAGDPIEPWLLFVNSHKGDRAVKVGNLPIRLFCTNQLGWIFKGAPRVHRILHVGDTGAKLAEATEIINGAGSYYERVKRIGDKLALTKITPQQLGRMLADLYPDNTQSDRAAANVEEARNTVRWIVTEAENLNGHHMTAWGFAQAACEVADWGSGRTRDSMGRLCADKDMKLKQRALEIACARAKVSLN